MEKSKDEFYLCLYLSDKEYIGHRVSASENFPEEWKSLDQKDKKESESEYENETGKRSDANNIDKVFLQFKNSMLGYLDILPIISSFVPGISSFSRMKGVKNFVADHGILQEKAEEYEIYKINHDSLLKFIQMDEKFSTASLVGRQIPKMLIIGIVSSYEHHFSLLLKEIFIKYPEKLENSKREFTVRDVFQSNSIEEFRDNILEKEIDNILRESFVEQVKWIEKNLPLSEPISPNYKGWDELVEVFERRNLYAHANGIVNSQYMKRESSVKSKASKGAELMASAKYIISSIENICEFGTKMIQVVWRKMEKDQSDLASQRLGELGYELIGHGRYRLATRILEFGRTLRGDVGEQRKRMDIVNLANAYRLMGDNEKCESLINSVDWTITNNEFKICVAAVKEDDKQVIEMMEKVSLSDDFVAKNFEEWPVFIRIRKNRDFCNEFERIYKKPYVPLERNKSTIFSVFDEDVDDASDDKQRPATNSEYGNVAGKTQLSDADSKKMDENLSSVELTSVKLH